MPFQVDRDCWSMVFQGERKHLAMKLKAKKRLMMLPLQAEREHAYNDAIEGRKETLEASIVN